VSVLDRCPAGHILPDAGLRCRTCYREEERLRDKIKRENRRAAAPFVPYGERVEYRKVAMFKPDDVIVVFPAEYLLGVEIILRGVLARSHRQNDLGKAARYALAAIEAGRKGWDRMQPGGELPHEPDPFPAP
jgi:hypothetical protein